MDELVLRVERPLLERADDTLLVDFGVGEWPWTTLEWAQLLRACNGQLRVIGVEVDARRLRHARRLAAGEVEFRHGSFALPLARGERARLIRAMNVLRGYSESEAEAARLQLAEALVPGGLLIEGTSSHSGGVLCAHWLRKRDSALTREALVFSSDFSQGFAPWLFRDRLPRDLRRSCRPGSAIHAFFSAWSDAFEAARSTGVRESSALFALSALALSSRLSGIVCEPALIESGTLFWRPPDGVPSA
ncbi:MAG TPA: hypothetical protein VJR89_03505 [Polyangiales bacterium]|nr:hypothetical protein [Polyangiales bacterium]